MHAQSDPAQPDCSRRNSARTVPPYLEVARGAGDRPRADIEPESAVPRRWAPDSEAALSLGLVGCIGPPLGDVWAVGGRCLPPH
eukprot:1694202-Pyramimonas_sp.AAC.1